MRIDLRWFFVLLLSELLVFVPCHAAEHPRSSPPPEASPLLAQLAADLDKSYLDLFKLSPELHFTDDQ